MDAYQARYGRKVGWVPTMTLERYAYRQWEAPMAGEVLPSEEGITGFLVTLVPAHRKIVLRPSQYGTIRDLL